jgi:hypothetical protein
MWFFFIVTSFVNCVIVTSKMFEIPKTRPKTIVPYEWILENVGEEPMTITSKMISFGGEKVFRVGLKNYAEYAILFFVEIYLVKIGMEVEDVKYGIQGSGIGPATMMEMKKEDIGGCENLHLFKTILDKKIVGNCTFSFRIVIAGTSEFYCYRLCDRLAKSQLWTALENQHNLADVEFVVKDKSFPAHKAILAARSPTFADEFEKIQPGKDGLHQIQIEIEAEPSTILNFLHFIYTGESLGTLADEKLFQLAHRYDPATLNTIGEISKMEMDATAMTKLMDSLNNEIDAVYPSKIM